VSYFHSTWTLSSQQIIFFCLNSEFQTFLFSFLTRISLSLSLSNPLSPLSLSLFKHFVFVAEWCFPEKAEKWKLELQDDFVFPEGLSKTKRNYWLGITYLSWRGRRKLEKLLIVSLWFDAKNLFLFFVCRKEERGNYLREMKSGCSTRHFMTTLLFSFQNENNLRFFLIFFCFIIKKQLKVNSQSFKLYFISFAILNLKNYSLRLLNHFILFKFFKHKRPYFFQFECFAFCF
jgi:hypothetical protein